MSDLAELGRRAAVAARRLVEMGRLEVDWLRGMRALDTAGYWWRYTGGGWAPDGNHALKRLQGPPTPDLSDPLTALGLLLLVREASGDADSCTLIDPWFTWEVSWCPPEPRNAGGVHGSTEAEALVLALEALAGEG